MTINDIISELISSNYDILSVLRKVKVIASKTGNDDLIKWVDKELNGYEKGDDIPDYRKTYCSVEGMVSNGFYYQKNTTLPTAHLSQKIKELLTRAIFYEPMSELISLTERDNDFLHTSIDPNFFHYINQIYDNGYHVQSAHGVLPISVIGGIIGVVGNRLLDFLLELSKIIDPDLDIIRITKLPDGSLGDIQNLAQQIFHGTVHMNGVNQVGSTGNITINYTQELIGKGVHEDDVQELKEIAKITDIEERQKQKNGWMKKVGTYLPVITTMVDFIDTAMEAFL